MDGRTQGSGKLTAVSATAATAARHRLPTDVIHECELLGDEGEFSESHIWCCNTLILPFVPMEEEI